MTAGRSAAAASPEAAGLPPGFRLIDHASLGSTNDEAKRLARAGAAEGTIVRAHQQTAGRGRRGRAWVSPPGNLAASFILRPDVAPAAAGQLGFLCAVALAETLAGPAARAGAALALKWPNDVLLAGGKLAGILLESETGAAGRLGWVVAGIGVNIAGHPDGLEYPATSLRAAGIIELDADRLLLDLSRSLASWLAVWRRDGFAPLRAAWLACAAPRGTPLRVRLDGAAVCGRFAGLDPAGALLVETESGVRRIAAGDVFAPAG